MAEQEILPCPNSECPSVTGHHDCYVETEDAATSVHCHRCGMRGPRVLDWREADDAIRMWNALPREEPWIEVAKAGLPDERVGETVRFTMFDVRLNTGDIYELIQRNASCNCWCTDDRISLWWDHIGSARVTHYRIHRAPKGPKG